MAFTIMAVEESDSTVGFYNSDTGEEIARIAVGLWPHEIAVSKDRKVAYVSNFGIKDYDEHIGQPGASVSVLDLEAMAERERLYTFRGARDYARRLAPHSVVLDEDRSRLLVNVEAEDTLLRFDLADVGGAAPAEPFLASAPGAADALPDAESRLPEGTHAMLLSPDGDQVYLGCGPGGLVELDAETGTIMRSLDCSGPVRGLAFTTDGRELIVSAGGALCYVDPKTLLIKRRHDLKVLQLLYPTATPDGRHVLVPAVWEGLLLKVDVATGKASSLIVGADPIHLIIPGDGDIAFLGHGRAKYISRIDWNKFQEVGRIETRGGPNGLDWAPLRERPARKRLRVGAAIPLSGPSRSEGNDLRLGYQYWTEQVNAAGGLVSGGEAYEVELLLEDTRSVVGRDDEPPLPNGTTAKEHLRRIGRRMADAGASVLFGTYPSPPHFVLREVAEERGIPLITASGAASVIYSPDFPNTFGIMSIAKGFLNGSFDLLARQLPPPRTALFLSCQDNAAREDAQTTAEYIAGSLGIEVVGPAGQQVPPKDRIVQFAHNQLQFDELLDQAVALDPDVLAITGHLPESIAITRALAERNWAPKAILFSVGPALPDFVRAVGPLAEHLMGSAMWSASQVSHGHDRFITPRGFRDAFYARFSKEASYLAAGAVACGIVVEEAVRRAGSVRPHDLASVLRDNFSIESFYSPISLDDNGVNSGRGLLTIQLRHGAGGIEHASLWPPALAGPSPSAVVWPFPGWPDPGQASPSH